MARKRKIESDPIVSSGATAAQSRRQPAIRVKHSPVPPESLSPSEFQPRDVTPYEPTREEIAKQAYAYWEARGCQGGSAEEDWVRAEQELRSRTAAMLV